MRSVITVLSSVLAMAIAVPIAVGVALCLTQYLPKKISGTVSFVVDLLAESLLRGRPLESSLGNGFENALGELGALGLAPLPDPRETLLRALVVQEIKDDAVKFGDERRSPLPARAATKEGTQLLDRLETRLRQLSGHA